MSQSSARGFTLIELVVTLVVLGVLAAFAVPRFLNVAPNARIAAVHALGGAIDSAAYLTESACMTSASTSGCSTSNSSWQGSINGISYWLNYGWPDAGDALQNGQIDALIDYSGFTASLVNS